MVNFSFTYTCNVYAHIYKQTKKQSNINILRGSLREVFGKSLEPFSPDT